MAIRVIDVALDGTCAEMRLGTAECPILKASYADRLEPEDVIQIGSQEIDAQTPGIYKTENAKVSMLSTVFRAILLPVLDTRGFGNQRFAAHFNYSHAEIGQSEDKLDGCRIVNLAAAIEASSKALEVEIEMKVRQVYWEGKTINRIKGDPLSGAISVSGVLSAAAAALGFSF